MIAPTVDLTIARGKTLEADFLQAADEPLLLPISAMPSKVPLRLTVALHGLPDDWPVWIANVKTPAELNSGADYKGAADLMDEADPYWISVIDASTIQISDLLASAWRPLSGNGVLVTRPPADLTGWHCRGQIRDRIGGNVLFTWHSDPAEQRDAPLLVDVERGAYVATMSAEQSAALTWRRGVYDLEAIDPAGRVYPVVAPSPVTVTDEVTA